MVKKEGVRWTPYVSPRKYFMSMTPSYRNMSQEDQTILHKRGIMGILNPKPYPKQLEKNVKIAVRSAQDGSKAQIKRVVQANMDALKMRKELIELGNSVSDNKHTLAETNKKIKTMRDQNANPYNFHRVGPRLLNAAEYKARELAAHNRMAKKARPGRMIYTTE